ncbi:MAG: PrgI family protein [Lachnospiraceae bacterium]|nr:PrgI family protein [Lachnospiraceae bacterium]
MAYIEKIPVDVSQIKNKIAFGLTRRQIICFSAAALAGIPVYFAARGVIGSDLAALLMVVVMMPFFFLAMYEKDGFPAEKLLYQMIRQRYLRPGIRPYQSENIYLQMEKRQRMRKEIQYLESKANRRKTGGRKKTGQ